MRYNRLLQNLAASNLALVLGCGQPPIDWEEPRLVSGDLARARFLAFDGERLVSGDAPRVSPPVFPRQCAGSARVAHDSTSGDWYAAWWGPRGDSTADVLASHSRDGVTWTAPVRVDTADVGRIGCHRPPPSVAADRGNFHVAYAMTAREGPGIFASHSMDRGAMFHSPVAVVYGERIGGTAIAAKGDVVVVAYEDPNTEPRRISVALSRTMAHLFQSRVSVSPPGARARAPDVALGNGRVAVTWLEGTGDDLLRMIRFGVIR